MIFDRGMKGNSTLVDSMEILDIGGLQNNTHVSHHPEYQTGVAEYYSLRLTSIIIETAWEDGGHTQHCNVFAVLQATTSGASGCCSISPTYCNPVFDMYSLVALAGGHWDVWWNQQTIALPDV